MIWRMLLDGCDAPLTVWIDKMWQPLGQLILAWYTIDLMNIFTAWLRPVGRPLRDRSGRHLGGGKKGRRGGLTSLPGKAVGFDPGEWIGEQIYGGEELRHRNVPPGVIYMWSLYGVIERINWYFMVLDLGGDFLYNWASSIVRMGYCGNKDDSILLATREVQHQQGIFGWSPVLWQKTEKNRKLTFWNLVGVSQITGPGSLYSRADIYSGPGTPGPRVCEIRLRCLSGPSVGKEAIAQEILPIETHGSIAIAETCLPHDLWIVEFRVIGDWRFDNLEFFMQAPWQAY